MAGEAYLTNPQVMHETIEGETIIIDLSTGTYFSLRGSGPAIWNALVGGADTESVRASLERVYEGAPGEIEGALDAFLAQLEREGLIAPGAATSAAAARRPAAPRKRTCRSTPGPGAASRWPARCAGSPR